MRPKAPKSSSVSHSLHYLVSRPLIEHLDTGDIDHPGCAKAILSGLAKKTSKSFLIHLTGTACISDMNEQSWEGKVNQRIWDDVQDIDEIYNLPETAWHHAIDQWIADASNDKVKTVAICPPDLYGQSTTVGGRTTYLVPEYVAAIIKYKEAFYLGEGQNVRAVTHIDDLTEFFVLVLEKYLEGGEDLQYGREVRKAQQSLSLKYHRLLAQLIYTGFLLCDRGRGGLEIDRRSHKQDWPGAGLVACRHPNSVLDQGTAGCGTSRPVCADLVYLGLKQQSQVDKGKEARMEAAWA